MNGRSAVAMAFEPSFFQDMEILHSEDSLHLL